MEDLPIEQLIPNLAVEALDVAILSGTAFLNEQRTAAQPGQPAADPLGGELRAVVGADEGG